MKKDEKIIAALLAGKVGKKYEGRGVVVCDGKIYPLPKDDEKAGKFFDQIIADNPTVTPTITFVPKRINYTL